MRTPGTRHPAAFARNTSASFRKSASRSSSSAISASTARSRTASAFPSTRFTPPINNGITTHSTHVSVIPDLNINVGYMITPNVQAYVGYNYMYWSNVARLGSQSVAAANSGQGHLNLHGADFGVQFRY